MELIQQIIKQKINKKEVFYLTMHSTNFNDDFVALDIQ